MLYCHKTHHNFMISALCRKTFSSTSVFLLIVFENHLIGRLHGIIVHLAFANVEAICQISLPLSKMRPFLSVCCRSLKFAWVLYTSTLGVSVLLILCGHRPILN